MPEFNAELLPLGTRAGLATIPHAKNTCYILKIKEDLSSPEEDFDIMFDIGSHRALEPKYLITSKLKALFLSHAHLDHTIYLGLFIRRLKKEKRKEPLLLFLHENGWKSMKRWIKLFCFKIPEFIKWIPIGLQIDETHLKEFDVKCTTDLTQINHVGTFNLDTDPIGFKMDIKVAPALHSISSVVYRLKIYKDSTQYLDFMFSPDTSYSSTHLIPFAKNAKYWLLDSAFAKEIIDERYELFVNRINNKKAEIVCHSGPYYSGKICEAANVENYLMGHYCWDRFTEKYDNVPEAMASRAHETYSGNTIVTLDLKPINLELSKEDKN